MPEETQYDTKLSSSRARGNTWYETVHLVPEETQDDMKLSSILCQRKRKTILMCINSFSVNLWQSGKKKIYASDCSRFESQKQ